MNVSAAAATHFALSAPGSATAGTAFNFTITAQDQFNNTVTGYAGTAHFTSTDAQAVLPANTTLTTGTFSATLKTAGSQTLTGTDTVTGSITGTSGGITVSETVTLAATDTTAAVSGGDTGTYRFTRGGSGGTLVANFQLDAASTAEAAEFSLSGGSVSFNGSTGTVTIPNGSTSVDVTLTATANATGIAKPSKTVQLDVATGSGYSVGAPANVTVTIAQNGFVVTNTNDAGQGSLRQAILNANALGGSPTITFDPTVFATPKTITLTSGQLKLSASQTVQGPGAGLLTVSGNNAFRVYQIDAGQTVTLSGMTITGGNGIGTTGSGKGGGIYNSGTLNVADCRVTGNTTPTSEGGGIDNAGTQLTLTNCQIDNNTASFSGGGIIARSGTVKIAKCTVSNNSVTGATGGAGGGIESDCPTLIITNSTFSGNHADNSGANSGGGIYVGAGRATIISSTITGNSVKSTGSAGGVRNDGATSVTIQDTIVAGNSGTSSAKADVSGAFTSSSYNLIGDGTGSTGLTNSSTGNIVGTSGSPIDAKLGPLQNNGGPTQTMALLNGSPAINAGSNALAVDENSVALTTDQRGTGFPRVQGTTVDIGAFEALLFTPTLSNATTNEDTQSTGGLVITANVADGGGTTNYKITNILGGTLYKNDGTTAIAAGSFITKAEGAAGLKFTPSANLFSPVTTFSFDVQASISAADAGLKDAVVTATITVNPVAEVPSVTNSSATTGTQTTSGLVISRNALDGMEIAFFKITNIQHGTLYKNNGTTVISAGDFITFAEGNAGLKFTSTNGFLGQATFDVAGSVDNAGAGLGPVATATINVGTVNPTPAQIGTSGTLNRQNGLYELTVNVTNTTAFDINGFRLHVDYSAYKTAFPSLKLQNATSYASYPDVYVDYPYPVKVGATVPVRLSFYTSNRAFPNPFSPVLNVATLATSQTAQPNGPGVQVDRIVVLNPGPNQTMLLEFPSVAGHWYRISYSTNDMSHWYDSAIPVQAGGSRMQWIDTGAPLTDSPPAPPNVTSRFYKVSEIVTP